MDSYKSLIAWQRAAALSGTTLEVTDDTWTAKRAAVFDQLRRAAISVDVNIVEGYALNTVPLFRKHLRIAIGSAAEVERLLVLAEKRRYLDEQIARKLQDLAGATMRALIGLMRSRRLRRRR